MKKCPIADSCGKIRAVGTDKKPGCPHEALREVEEALRRNQRRFAAFMENLPGPAFMKDREGRYLYVNRQFAEALGLRIEDLIGKTLFEMVPESLALTLREADENVLAKGKPVDTCFTFSASNGPHRWLVVRFPIHEAEGEEPLIGGVSLDVTKHKQAEDALRESEEKYRLLVENSGETVYIMDADGRYLLANKEAAERLEKKPEDLVGRTEWDFFPKEQADAQVERVRQVMRAGQPERGDFYAVVRGRDRIYRTILTPVRSSTGEVTSVMVVASDITGRVATWHALRDSEEKYRLLVESTDESIFTLDAGGRYVFVNGPAAARLGKKPQDLVGKTAWDAFPKEIADEQVKHVRQVIASGQGSVHETPTVILGQARWYRTSINPVRDSDGKVVSALVVARDISEQKWAGLALQKSEERFRLTFENAVDAIFWADPDTGVFLNCNRAAEKLIGWPRQEIIGRHYSWLHPPEELGKHESSIAESAKGAGVSHVYGMVLPRFGKPIPVHIAASLITVGSELIVQGIFRDMTELNQAWEALRGSQQRLMTVVSNAPIVLLLADTDGVIRFADGRALAALGRTGEQLVGQSIMSVCHDSRQMRQSMQSALAGQDAACLCEVAGRVFNVRLSPLRDDMGGITGVVGVATDVTSRHKAEAALDAARLKLLNVREEEQKRLARDLHDSIGQQLVAMKMAFASAGLAEQASKCVELIQETRRLCYNLYPPSLEALGLASALNQLARHCEQAVRIEVEYPPKMEDARFGPEKEIALFRIAQEAVSNAIRHGKARTIQLSLARRGGYIEMTIADDGCGFDPVAQAGKGLGLQTMADRIRAVGGTMGIDSRPGRTAIEVRVPLDQAASGPGAG